MIEPNLKDQNPSLRRPFRVGVLLADFVQPHWVCEMLDGLRASGVVEVCAVFIRQDAETSGGQVKQRRCSLVYRTYQSLDTAINTRGSNEMQPVDIERFFSCPVSSVVPESGDESSRAGGYCFEGLLAYKLDILLNLDFGKPAENASHFARFGLWEFVAGDGTVPLGQAGFWEVMRGDPVTCCGLRILTKSGDIWMQRTWNATDRFSAAKNRRRCLGAMQRCLSRKLRDIQAEGSLAPDKCCAPTFLSTKPDERWPTNVQMTRLLASLGMRKLFDIVCNRLLRYKWLLAFRITEDATARFKSLDGYTVAAPPPDRFWADPFPIVHEGRYYVFLEELPYNTGRGHVSVIEVREDGSYSDPVVVLKKDHHLSYPCVFRYDSRYYMVPESAGNGNVELYECQSFPYEWRLRSELLSDVKARDATIFEAAGRWWMLVSQSAQIHDFNELYLYYADSPLGPWTAHKRNPVKVDIRSSRPAGRPFIWNGKLCRPAQDCSKLYGHAIVIEEITTLNTEEYAEVEVGRVDPNWMDGLIGTHTFNCDGGLEVIDGLLRVPRFHP